MENIEKLRDRFRKLVRLAKDNGHEGVVASERAMDMLQAYGEEILPAPPSQRSQLADREAALAEAEAEFREGTRRWGSCEEKAALKVEEDAARRRKLAEERQKRKERAARERAREEAEAALTLVQKTARAAEWQRLRAERAAEKEEAERQRRAAWEAERARRRRKCDGAAARTRNPE